MNQFCLLLYDIQLYHVPCIFLKHISFWPCWAQNSSILFLFIEECQWPWTSFNFYRSKVKVETSAKSIVLWDNHHHTDTCLKHYTLALKCGDIAYLGHMTLKGFNQMQLFNRSQCLKKNWKPQFLACFYTCCKNNFLSQSVFSVK